MTPSTFVRRIFTAVALTLFLSLPLEGETGRWVAERMTSQDTSRDASVAMKVFLTDSRGRTTLRTLTFRKKDTGGREKLLLRFTEPADIRGTSFLVWRHKGEEDERFLYLPALGRSRRLSSGERTESFAGTDFTYEDISGQDTDEFTYHLEADTTVLSGETCYTLVSTPKGDGYDYSRIVTLVEQESFLPLEATYVGADGMPFKRFRLIERENIEGIWTMMEMVMEHLLDNHRTRIRVTDVQYDTGIDDSMFTRRELERGVDE